MAFVVGVALATVNASASAGASAGASASASTSASTSAGASASASAGAKAALAAPAGYRITGIDVSAFQGSISWGTVARGGALFAYIRASEQAGIADPFFPANYQAAKASGLYAGAYHRARPNLSGGREQAAYFLDRAGYVSDGGTLPPMLDIEWPRTNWTGVNACYNMTPAQMTTWIRDFVDEVLRRTGRLAMIYTNTNWWRPCTNDSASFRTHPLFIASYAPTPPPLPAGWTRFELWQYADSGALPGDQDVFNGDYSALTRLAGGTPAPVSLLAFANGRYVTAENAGGSALIANRTRVGSWERFHRVNAGSGFVALRSNVNGRFVTAENAGRSPLIANRTVIGSWERFRIITNADGSISLRAGVNDRLVTAENAGRSPLIANRTAIGRWEKFRLGPA
jgi:GH25 family lysozyme M1 (1,4-beta-N-acetylmuramidase)